MIIGMQKAAALLRVSEKTVSRWISDHSLPAHKVGDHYRFNRAELLEWSIAHKQSVSPDLLVEDEHIPVPSLHDALQKGGIFYQVPGQDVQHVLAEAIGLIKFPDDVDTGYLLQVLLARESLGSTGIGNGIAMPHARNPIVMHIVEPVISLCFLKHPIDFKAIDNKPVHTLFTIVSPSSGAHLQLLSKLSFALRDPGVSDAVKKKADRDEILSKIKKVELDIQQSPRG